MNKKFNSLFLVAVLAGSMSAAAMETTNEVVAEVTQQVKEAVVEESSSSWSSIFINKYTVKAAAVAGTAWYLYRAGRDYLKIRSVERLFKGPGVDSRMDTYDPGKFTWFNWRVDKQFTRSNDPVDSYSWASQEQLRADNVRAAIVRDLAKGRIKIDDEAVVRTFTSTSDQNLVQTLGEIAANMEAEVLTLRGPRNKNEHEERKPWNILRHVTRKHWCEDDKSDETIAVNRVSKWEMVYNPNACKAARLMSRLNTRIDRLERIRDLINDWRHELQHGVVVHNNNNAPQFVVINNGNKKPDRLSKQEIELARSFLNNKKPLVQQNFQIIEDNN